MMYSQLTRREGLRDLVACLNSQRSKLYHGIRGEITRSTRADGNEASENHARFETLLKRPKSSTSEAFRPILTVEFTQTIS